MVKIAIKLAVIFTVAGFFLVCFGLTLYTSEAQEGITQEQEETVQKGDIDENEETINIETQKKLPEIVFELTYPTSQVPIILSRSFWENSTSFTNLLWWFPEEGHTPPDYHPIERIIVHDLGCPISSPTCNSDEVDPISVIQSVYRYHSITRGWGDIGYHYIIARDGRIFEGRYGGNAVRGAHTYHDRNCDNFNVGSVGIVLLGNYGRESQGAVMPESMKESLEKLVAWVVSTNNLDLESSFTSKIWNNPKTASGNCDISSGSFSTSFTGPRLLSHGDVELGNGDKFDLSKTNQNAMSLLPEINKFVFNTKGDGTKIFEIKNGILTDYLGEVKEMPTSTEPELSSREEQTTSEEQATSTEELANESVQSSTEENNEKGRYLLTVNKNQLDAFPKDQEVALYPENTILKSYTRNTLFVIKDGERRKITSTILAQNLGLNLENPISLSDRELAKYALGYTLTYPEGSLLAEESGDVYVIENYKRRHITSASLFETLKYIWSNIMPTTKEELKIHQIGEPMYFSEGALIKGEGPRVYLIEDIKIRPIGSAALFEKLRLKWGEIKNLEDFEIERYAMGNFVLWPDETFIKTESSEKVYIVKDNGKREWIPSAEEFEARGYKWSNIMILEEEEIKIYPEIEIAAQQTEQPEKPEPTKETPTMEEPNVRVGLYTIKLEENFVITASGTFEVYQNENLILGTDEGGKEFVLTYSELNKEDIWTFVPGEKSILEISSYEDRPTWNQNLNDNKFRGSIEVRYSDNSQKYWVINELPLEDYLKGVAETINGDPPEYGKAFEIAARTYAMYHINRGGKRAGEPYHLINTSSDQIYKGYGFELRAYDPVAAVKATRGEVATYNGEIIVAAYSSGAPGPTLSACDLWGGMFCEDKFNYLDGGVEDPEGAKYIFDKCGGMNHCVGMDAAGARRLAELGKTYQEILKHYYLEVELKKLY